MSLRRSRESSSAQHVKEGMPGNIVASQYGHLTSISSVILVGEEARRHMEKTLI